MKKYGKTVCFPIFLLCNNKRLVTIIYRHQSLHSQEDGTDNFCQILP